MTRVCILVLIGLPGSGKSTYARMLQSLNQRQADGRGDERDFAALSSDGKACHKPSSDNIDSFGNGYAQQISSHYFYHVVYDEIMPTDIEGELLSHIRNMSLNQAGKDRDVSEEAGQIQQDHSKWKSYRRKIVRCVENHMNISLMEGSKNPCKGNSVDADLHEPDTCSDVWDLFVKSLKAQPKEENVDAETKNRDIVYIIDDNMYYRSMRYEYYQLARKYQTGFAQIYFDTPVETAKRRNEQRPCPVRSEVISTMASRMEPPNSLETCDKHALVLTTERPADKNMPKILQLIQDAISDPVPAVESENEEEKAASRVVCSTNLIHQSDQVLRKLVASTLSMAKSEGLDKTNLKELAQKMNGERQHILQEMKQGRILVESVLNDEVDAGKRGDSTLFTFIKSLFDQTLKDKYLTLSPS